jgi:hypothetical protein
MRKLYWRFWRVMFRIRNTWWDFEWMWGGAGCSYWFEVTMGPLTLTARRRMTEEEIDRQ